MLEVEDGELSGWQAIVAKRLSICSECPRLIKPVQLCKECGCFMPVKTKFKNNKCPLDKWDIEETHEQK